MWSHPSAFWPPHCSFALDTMSSASTSYCQVASRTCYLHGTFNCPESSCAVSQVLVHPASPAFTTVTMRTRRSPVFTISPLPGVPPLPASLGVVGFQNTHNYGPPNPTVSAPVLTTPSVNPLVALGSGLCHGKVLCDVSEYPINVCVSKLWSNSAPITEEQKRSLVVEGALHRRFRVKFDHPGLTRTWLDFQGILTIRDLLTEIHWHFHERIGHGEKNHLKKDMNLWKVASDTQVKRCQDVLDCDAEWKRGMKRVDILGKECKFHGVYLGSSFIGDHLTLRVVFGK